MNASGACVSLIKRSELCRLVAYRDPGGVLSNGWGHTGKDVYDGQVITQEQADLWLRLDVKRAELELDQVLRTHPCTQGQYDAMVDFVYNLGIERLIGSTLLRKFLAGDVAGAAAEFPRWVYERRGSTEVENQGLLERRKAEQRFFLGSVA